MARDEQDERAVLAEFERWRRDHPDAALILGTVRLSESQDGCVTRFGLVGCDALDLMAAANDLLEAASEKLRTHPQAGEMHAIIGSVEHAMAVLNFRETGPAQ